MINRNHFIDGGADRVYLNTGKLFEDYNYEVAYFSTEHENNINTVGSSYFIKKDQIRGSSFFSKFRSLKNYLYNEDAATKLASLIDDFQPEVAHIHLFYGVLSSSILKVLRKCNIPIVTTIHDYRLLCPANAMLDRMGNICEKCNKTNFHNCVINRCSDGSYTQSAVLAAEAYLRIFHIDPIEYIDFFVFVSDFSKRKHISYDPRYKSKSVHLYNFATSITERLDSRKGDYLFYYGRLSREKGIIRLINAAMQTNSKLIIAGDGPLRLDIIEKIKGLSNISFVGFQSGKKLKNLILNSSFVVVPSEWYENNPMTIVESFSLGKPVIGSNLGGIPELLISQTGFIFESGNLNSLVKTIQHAESLSEIEYNEICSNCRTFSKTYFDREQHFEKLSKIYKTLVYDTENTHKLHN
jgi:glycosyltransferase involved in cell wall biosynthesis